MFVAAILFGILCTITLSMHEEWPITIQTLLWGFFLGVGGLIVWHNLHITMESNMMGYRSGMTHTGSYCGGAQAGQTSFWLPFGKSEQQVQEEAYARWKMEMLQRGKRRKVDKMEKARMKMAMKQQGHQGYY